MAEVQSPREIIQKSPEEIKRTKYFSDFSLRYGREMRILKKGEILGKENQGWRNVSEHCLLEAVIADVIAEAVKASDEERKKVVKATLLHDWFKRREVESMNKSGGVRGHEVSTEEELKLLQGYGVDNEILPLIHANIPESSAEEYLQGRSLQEKIVHFADAILSGTTIIDFHERMDLKNQKPYMIELSESMRNRYDGKSLLEFQIQVAEAEQAEFEEAIGIDHGTLYNFIKTKIQERIDAHSLNTNYYE